MLNPDIFNNLVNNSRFRTKNTSKYLMKEYERRSVRNVNPVSDAKSKF